MSVSLKEEKVDYKRRGAMPMQLTIQVDTREKYPVSFPSHIRVADPVPNRFKDPVLVKLRTEEKALPYGDYRLKEFPDCCVIERKAGQREIFKNLFEPADAIRQAKSLRKLSACEHPYILIEVSPADLLKKNKERPVIANPELLANRLAIVLSKYNLNVLWLPIRRSQIGTRTLGLFLAHLMVGYAMRPYFDILPEILDGEED